jgi:hypothetical protein
MNFFQQYETSSVMKIDLCANKNQDQRSEAQTLQNFLCNLGLSKIKHFLNFRMSDSPHYMVQPLCIGWFNFNGSCSGPSKSF